MSPQQKITSFFELLLFIIVNLLIFLPLRLYYFFFDPYFLDWYHLIISRKGVQLLSHEEFMIEKRRELVEVWETAPMENRIEQLIFQSTGVNYLIFTMEGYGDVCIWKAQKEQNVEWLLADPDPCEPRALAMLGLLNLMHIHEDEHTYKSWATPTPPTYIFYPDTLNGLYRIRFRGHQGLLIQFVQRLATDVYKLPLEEVRFRVG